MNKIINRCVIVVLYDKDGIFDEYVFFLIKELKTVSNYIYVVINGNVQEQYLLKLTEESNKVVMRENKGFDAGAYREIILNHMAEGELQKYDEVIFCNDTFFGPFIPFVDIFENMKKKECDYWGINYEESGFMSHVHSYFLVFRNKIVKGRELEYFFKNVLPFNISAFSHACIYYEVGLTQYLHERGFLSGAVMIKDSCSIYLNSDSAIEEYGSPILKKKMFSTRWFKPEIHLRALQIIQKKYNYDMNMIFQTLNRLYGINVSEEEIWNSRYERILPVKGKPHITHEKLIKHIYKSEKIYIYGMGFIEERIGDYIIRLTLMNQIAFSGFIVSDGMKNCEMHKKYPVFESKDIKFNEKGVGVIVLLGYDNTMAVKNNLKQNENVLFIL